MCPDSLGGQEGTSMQPADILIAYPFSEAVHNQHVSRLHAGTKRTRCTSPSVKACCVLL